MPPNSTTTTAPPPPSSIALSYENDDLSLVPSLKQKHGYRTAFVLYVNGDAVPPGKLARATPEMTLLDYLRNVLLLTGSKLGCSEGGCGACTVMISKWDSAREKILHYSVNACLMPVAAADGCHVTTVEGVGTTVNGLHPIQERMIEYHGSQCGFCTPGIVVAAYAVFASREGDGVSEAYVEEHMDGNLCRCTGYRPIWDAVKSLCCGDDGKKCGDACGECPISSSSDEKVDAAERDGVCTSTTADKKRAPTAGKENFLDQPDLMFPDALKQDLAPLLLCGKNCSWFKPVTLEQTLSLLSTVKDLKIVTGNTEIGIDVKFRHRFFPRYLYPGAVPALTSVVTYPDRYEIGACASLTSIMKAHNEESSGGCTILKAFHDMLRWFASNQIRNVACLGGNLVNASPIADMNPMLMAADARLEIASEARGVRTQSLDDFFVSYRKVTVESDEIVTKVVVPRFENNVLEYLIPLKQARRREDDISIVTAGMRVSLERSATDDDGSTVVRVKYAKFAFGGMAATTVPAPKTCAFLTGKVFSEELFDSARRVLMEDLPLGEDPPGGQAEYRRALAGSFLKKTYLKIALALSEEGASLSSVVVPPAEARSGAADFLTSPKPSVKGTQTYPAPKYVPGWEKDHESLAAMNANPTASGQPARHASGPYHCTGEAVYVDDIPLREDALHAAYICAAKTHCRVTSVDVTPATAMEGVLAVLTAKDMFPGTNSFGPIVHDEKLFYDEEVPYVNAPLGVAVATSHELALKAARAVVVTYEDLPGPAVICIEDAIDAGSFYESTRHVIETTDTADLFTSDPDGAVVVEGEYKIGGQEHFYLECQTSLAVPTEANSGMEVFSSSQANHKVQSTAAQAAGLPMNKVICRVKRMGGGFGGKETRCWPMGAAAAFAARKTGRPVRLSLERGVDMSISGGRHAFLGKYKASAYMKDGVATLGAFDVAMFSNGGSGIDLSGPVMDRALFHIDNVYKWRDLRAEGIVCKTEQPPHTAYRGFGGPQSMAVVEHVVTVLADKLAVDVHELRRNNFYKEEEETHFGQKLIRWNVPRAWDELKVSTEFEKRQESVKEFNKKNKYRKQGIVMLPTKFGIAFTAKFMNQGGALVHVYTDGTVLVSHGGTEMGQGLHTKICQITAQAFNIPLSHVFIDESSTDKVPNAQPSAASMSTDLYGMATLDACQKILKNLEPIKKKLPPDATFKDIASAAFFERIHLSAHGFWTLPEERCGYDFTLARGTPNAERGHPFNYFTQGVATAHVEIDVLTGDCKPLRCDVVVDVGSSVNPAIDIGQIEGAFVQGMGWSTLEELIWADKDHGWVRPAGRLFTSGPGFYKIPSFNDTPEEFNVSLMTGVDNPFAVASSKAVGEPPFFLGTCVYYAILDAVKAAREEFGRRRDEEFVLSMPASSERIRMACADEIAVEGCLGKKDFVAKGSF